jgi:hypothetical protein
VVHPYPAAPQERHYLPSVTSKAAGSTSLSSHRHLRYKHIYRTVMIRQTAPVVLWSDLLAANPEVPGLIPRHYQIF